MQVKQISGNRSSIAVPMSSWGAFRDVLGELQEKMTASKGSDNDAEEAVKPGVDAEKNTE